MNTPVPASDQSLPRTIPALKDLRAYAVPRHPAPCDLFLDANEGPPDPRLTALPPIDIESLRRYPNTRDFERTIAARFDLDPSRVLVTAGGDDAIDRCIRATCCPGRSAICHTPTFEMIPRSIRLTGAECLEVPWSAGTFPTEAVVAAVRPDTACIAIVSPNNPTGLTVPTDAVMHIARRYRDRLILADAAYAEFADTDPTQDLLREPNIVVVRTFSKAWGLAGLRVGYALSTTRSIDRLRAIGGPYALAGPSLAIAMAVLRSSDDRVKQVIRDVRHERAVLVEILRSLGAGADSSEGNFVLARTPRAAWLRDACAGAGIAVRAYPDRPGLTEAVRITCPASEASFARLMHALRAALSPQAILFDLSASGVTTLARDTPALAALAQRVPLGMISDPSHCPAPRLLNESQHAHTFRAVVRRDSTAPMPEPIITALRGLQASHAWLVTDSIDGIAAARESGVIPIGFTPPGGPPELSSTLLSAGAARVLTSLDQLNGLLP